MIRLTRESSSDFFSARKNAQYAVLAFRTGGCAITVAGRSDLRSPERKMAIFPLLDVC